MSDENRADGERPGTGIDRRTFLGSAAVGIAATSLSLDLLTNVAGASVVPPARKPSLTYMARRREDQLSVRFDLYNFTTTGTGDRRRLVRIKSGEPAYMVVSYQAQGMAEQAFLLTASPFTTEQVAAPGRVQSRLAEPSRIGLLLPVGTNPAIPVNLGALFNWARFTPILSDAARRNLPPRVHTPTTYVAPQDFETVLELPWRVVLSPLPAARWEHASEPVDRDGFTELFTSRMVHGEDVRIEGGPIRATWNFDVQRPTGLGKLQRGRPTLDARTPGFADSSPFRTSLDTDDRYQIVKASSDFGGFGRRDVPTSRLWLTSMGGFLDAHGRWDFNSGSLNLAEWRHQSTMGRDQFVRVVKKGYLFPFGHRVVQIKVTERVFGETSRSTPVEAALRQRVFLVVQQPVRQLVGPDAEAEGQRDKGRRSPFTQLRIVTETTPPLDAITPLGGSIPATVYIPTVNHQPFAFHLEGTDWAGNVIKFAAPGIFVPSGSSTTAAQRINAYYNNEARDLLGTSDLQGQNVAIAEPDGAGDTDVAIHALRFNAYAPSSSTIEPYCFPAMRHADVNISAAAAATGAPPTDPTANAALAPAAAAAPPGRGSTLGRIEFPSAYVKAGFDELVNQGHAFAGVIPVPDVGDLPQAVFGDAASGGVMTPNFQIGGISRALGPVGGEIGDLAAGKFDPVKIFKFLDAKLLGGVVLKDLIMPVEKVYDSARKEVDKKAMLLKQFKLPDAVEVRLDWEPDIIDNPIVTKIPDRPDDFYFGLHALARTTLPNIADPTAPPKITSQVSGELRNFNVVLFGDTTFITLTVNRVRFTAAKGQDPHVDVELGDVVLGDSLEFVRQLADYLKQVGGAQVPAGITVTPAGISASQSVSLPPIGIGIFALTHVTFDAAFQLPFDGRPANFSFEIAKREHPFDLQVAMFGGGGFFRIVVGTHGVDMIEASLEFGAMTTFSIAVASGSVHLTAGIYFSYGTPPNNGPAKCVLSGFVRLGGEAKILGLVSLSVEFYLALSYDSSTGNATGTATLTVAVDVAVFHKSVELTVTKTFGSEPSDPPFAAQLTADDFTTYARSFARVAPYAGGQQ